MRQSSTALPLSVDESQILFGDLHVHTTFSPDAFIMSVPLTGGTGLHPPSQACDFARYCSSLDFWSINDHAEGLTPRRWDETKKSVRECNAIAGGGGNPDMVTFLGWEWSQVSTDPNKHYGHKNVIFPDTLDAEVPARAIASPRELLAKSPVSRTRQMMMSLIDFENREFYWGNRGYYDEVAHTPVCDSGVDTRQLPLNCREVAQDPRELFTKLDQWGYDSIVIPHGNSWGMNTPATTTFDKQLNLTQHDPDRQILFEVYSGHGNAEEYRNWRASAKDEVGQLSCPETSDGYLPCCWRAGEIIKERCDVAGLDAPLCESRESEARQNFVDAGNSGHLTIPGQRLGDWLNCGVCPDCFSPPMDHRPASSAQYAMAKIAGMDSREPVPHSVSLGDAKGVDLVNLRNMERQNSFWLTGGLVAVHSKGREREAIWSGLKRREVYATSGDRILFYFDFLANEKKIPMGSKTSSALAPRFQVGAVGAFKQLPGCPDYARQALGEARLDMLCSGQCYNPGDERYLIDRIEVVRIRPQQTPAENVADLVEDPWRSFECEADQAGCQVEFEDLEFVEGGREAIYYVRAIQEQTQMINADNVRCEYDENGQCIDVDPCYGDYRTPASEDCLAPANQRAWSSPIFVGYDTQ